MTFARSRHQQRVDEFMRRAGQKTPEIPNEPDGHTRLLRARLILEEALETICDGLGVDIICAGPCKLRASDDGCRHRLQQEGLAFEIARPFDMPATVDGCCDLRVVTTGTLSACGVADDDVQFMVDRNNLEKFGPGHTISPEGKLLKPPGHQPPPIAFWLRRMGWGKPSESA